METIKGYYNNLYTTLMKVSSTEQYCQLLLPVFLLLQTTLQWTLHIWRILCTEHYACKIFKWRITKSKQQEAAATNNKLIQIFKALCMYCQTGSLNGGLTGSKTIYVIFWMSPLLSLRVIYLTELTIILNLSPKESYFLKNSNLFFGNW